MLKGYYSAKQEECLRDLGNSANIYLDINGNEVKVSQVGETPPNFDDVIELGTVTKFVRKSSYTPKTNHGNWHSFKKK